LALVVTPQLLSLSLRKDKALIASNQSAVPPPLAHIGFLPAQADVGERRRQKNGNAGNKQIVARNAAACDGDNKLLTV
jgi:hypothetical protein